MRLEAAAKSIEAFQRGALTIRLAELERIFAGRVGSDTRDLCSREFVDESLIRSAALLKAVAGQINVIIHAAGILSALPHLLARTERIEYLSLGAGNTGKAFDLVTDRRIAEFKFIQWTGGSETIRQNSLFKDFFGLAEAREKRRKYLYVLGLEQPLKFFSGRRSLSSVMSKNASLAAEFRGRFGNRFTVVREYYQYRRRRVSIVDLLPVLGALGAST